MYSAGSDTVLRLIWSGKKSLPTKAIHQPSISDVKVMLLTGNIGKHIKFVTFFVYTIDEISSIFFKLQWSLARSQSSRILITFFLS